MVLVSSLAKLKGYTGGVERTGSIGKSVLVCYVYRVWLILVKSQKYTLNNDIADLFLTLELSYGINIFLL